MAVTALPAPASRVKPSSTEIVKSGIRRRYAAERRFRLYGILAVAFGLTFLVILFTNIIARGYTSFLQSSFRLEVYLDPAVIDPSGTRGNLVEEGPTEVIFNNPKDQRTQDYITGRFG